MHKYTGCEYATAMFDSHAHMNDLAFDDDRDAVMSHVFNSGIAGWIEVGTNIEESTKAIALAETDSRIIASVGVHPHELKTLQDSDWDILSQLADHVTCKAIGEVGLDFSRDVEIDFQEKLLHRFIVLAQQKHLPIIFHVRSGNEIDAHEELIRILTMYPAPARPKGVIHTFSGTLAQAQAYIELGMMISFSGVLTFKKSDDLREAAKTLPLEAMLVETDCPYLTPEPDRGKRNDPSFVRFVIKNISELRDIDPLEVDKITQNNAKNLFSI